MPSVAGYFAVAASAYSIYSTATRSNSDISSVVGALTDSKNQAPAVAPPTKLPTPESTGNAAAKLSLVDQLQRRGRASTILTDTNTDKLGA